MYEKILVPLDGSKRAEMIRPHVRELASRFQATVILIKVVEINSARFVEEEFSGFWQKEFDAIVKEHKAYLCGVAAKLREKGIDCKTLVVHGPVVENIIEAANKEDADLIAMTRQRSAMVGPRQPIDINHKELKVKPVLELSASTLGVK